MGALDDRALVERMRAGDVWAWPEFYARFRPMLLDAMRGARLPDREAITVDALVDEVLTDGADRFTGPGAPVVLDVAAYLVRAARNRLLNVRRSAARRQRRHAAAATRDGGLGEAVVATLCSEHLLAAAEGIREAEAPDGDAAGAATPGLSVAVRELASVVLASVTADERTLLEWVAEQTSHRMIASWLTVSYDAATKRIWRLCRKLRGAAVRHLATLDPDVRREVERFLRRAGTLPPLVSAVSPVAACREIPRCPFGDDGSAEEPHPRSSPSPAPPPPDASSSTLPSYRRGDAPPGHDHE